MHLEIEKLYSKRPNSIKPGLERIRPAWNALKMNQFPQKNILIAGTNGKGSTAGILWRLLAIQGYKVGLYSSPHISSFSERFQCSHLPTYDTQIVDQLRTLQEALDPELYNDLSFFEVSTLLALNLFEQAGCDINILEIGLGGRLDACNIVNPDLCAVTSIDKDHVEWLGSELPGIAREKLGIYRDKIPLFWGERFTKEKLLLTTLSEFENREASEILKRYRNFGYDHTTEKTWVKFNEAKRLSFHVPQWTKESPPVIKENFALAFAMFYKFNMDTTKNNATNEELLKVTANFSSDLIAWPNTLIGRFQKIKFVDAKSSRSMTAYLDVCHNPASAQEFAKSFIALSRAPHKQKFQV